ncbi:MAG: DUF192 domain-containing protein [Candidatus Omnitrophota bacterium]
MRLINKTRNTVVAGDVFIAGSPLKRIKGLLGKKSFNKSQALIIKPCNSIHTFFMRFSIDALFMGRDNKVIQTLSGIKPFKFTRIYFQANYVIELPSGAIKDSFTAVGDHITLE